MEFVYCFAASVGVSVGLSYWLLRRAVAAIPKVEEHRHYAFHKSASVDFPHPKCDYCGLEVASHKPDSESKVVCRNCARERKM